MKKENEEKRQIYGQQYYQKKELKQANRIFRIFEHLTCLLDGMEVVTK